MPNGDRLEQQLRPRLAERQVTELVQDDEVQLREPGQVPVQLVLILCRLKLSRQPLPLDRTARGDLDGRPRNPAR